jgi:hypothetical protein
VHSQGTGYRSEHRVPSPPVLLLIFNRPEMTRRVFAEIAEARPVRLYVAADGPRAGVSGELNRCEESRSIATKVDWNCDVATRFEAANVGLAKHVSTSITWFFEHEEEGIVLEDDCVPDLSFFRFCSELLHHYRADPRVMHISGSNLQFGRRRGRGSYYFSRYPQIWGWASWRRAWSLYDFSLRPSWQIDNTWDTQWLLSIERARGVAIVPNVNLVTNIGFGRDATHTKDMLRAASVAAEEMTFPLVHPELVQVDKAADTFTYYVHHRLVKCLNLIWWYRLLDYLYGKLKPIKRRLLGTRA